MPVEPAQLNSHPALILRFDGVIDTVFAVRVDDRLITGLYSVANPDSVRDPDKLSRTVTAITLRRRPGRPSPQRRCCSESC
ncbi:hypothetical protein [Nocardia salmonicida]